MTLVQVSSYLLKKSLRWSHKVQKSIKYYLSNCCFHDHTEPFWSEPHVMLETSTRRWKNRFLCVSCKNQTLDDPVQGAGISKWKYYCSPSVNILWLTDWLSDCPWLHSPAPAGCRTSDPSSACWWLPSVSGRPLWCPAWAPHWPQLRDREQHATET